MPRQEAKKEASTRSRSYPQPAKQLREAAARLFALKGYEATSVREIVKQAGFTKPTLYYYFGSKEGLCKKMLGEGLQRLEDTIDKALLEGDDVRERLVNLVWAHFRFCLRNRELTKFIYSLIFGPPQRVPGFDFDDFVHTSCERLKSLLESELYRKGLISTSASEATRILLGIINIYVISQINRGSRILSKKAAAAAVEVFLHGVLSKGDTK